MGLDWPALILERPAACGPAQDHPRESTGAGDASTGTTSYSSCPWMSASEIAPVSTAARLGAQSSGSCSMAAQRNASVSGRPRPERMSRSTTSFPLKTIVNDKVAYEARE